MGCGARIVGSPPPPAGVGGRGYSYASSAPQAPRLHPSRRPPARSTPGAGQEVLGDRIGSPTSVDRERGEAMTETREKDVAPVVAATIEPVCETHRTLARAVMFAETGTGSGFHRSHPAPTTTSGAAREAKSFLTRSPAAPKIFGISRGDGSGIGDENSAAAVARRTSECDKKFRAPREPQVLDQRKKFCPAAPLVDRRLATAMTRSIER